MNNNRNLTLEEQIAFELANEIQKEIDTEILWDLIERENWPHYYYIELQPIDLVWVSYTFKIEDFVYRKGTIYFKQEKHLTWFKLKYPQSPMLRRA
jgi:hypothetical protein